MNPSERGARRNRLEARLRAIQKKELALRKKIEEFDCRWNLKEQRAEMAARRKENRERAEEYGKRRAEVKHLILAEMMRRKHTIPSFASSLGCSYHLVWYVLSGKKHSPRVLNGLRELGVPEYLLFDPRSEGQA
jgi:hypothetical protein